MLQGSAGRLARRAGPDWSPCLTAADGGDIDCHGRGSDTAGARGNICSGWAVVCLEEASNI